MLLTPDTDSRSVPGSFASVVRARQLTTQSFVPGKAEFLSRLLSREVQTKSVQRSGVASSKMAAERGDFSAVEQALWCVGDALTGVRRLHPLAGSRGVYSVSEALRPACEIVRVALLALSAFEPAPWCVHAPEICTLPQFHVFDAEMLHSHWSALIEAGACVLLLSELCARAKYQGTPNFKSVPSQIVSSILACGIGICAILRISGGSYMRVASHLAPLVRVGLFCSASVGVRRQLKMLVRLGPPFASVLVLLGAHLLVFAWLGTTLFPRGTVEGDLHFRGLGGGLWSLTVLLTTCNFPDVALPAYAHQRSYLAFFAIFALVGHTLLLSLLCAVVYKSYAEQHADDKAERRGATLDGLASAFTLLADLTDTEGQPAVSRPVAKHLLTELLKTQGVACASTTGLEAHAAATMRTLEEDWDGSISIDSFLLLASALEATGGRMPAEPTCAQAWCKGATKTKLHARLVRLVASGRLDTCVEMLLAVNVLMLVCEDLNFLTGSEKEGDEVGGGFGWDSLELLFALAFCAEVALRIWVLGWYRYWSQTASHLDFVVTAAAAVASVATLIPNQYNGSGTVRLILTVRLLRVLRLLGRFPHFAFVANTCIEVLPAASSLLTALSALCYLYSALGVGFYGGAICDAPAPGCDSHLLDGSDYVNMGYWPINFNSHADGMIVLFQLLLVNNWMVTADAYKTVSGSSLALVFFTSFYIIAVLVGLNVCQAFVLERFVERLSKDSANDKSVSDKSAANDKSAIDSLTVAL